MNIKSTEIKDIPALRGLWKEAFGDTDEFLDIFFATAFNKDRAFLLEADGEVAGALYWFSCEFERKPVAYIYAVATAVKYRGQGVCHKLMEHTHKHLKSLGYSGAILVPGSRELFEFYNRMGYETCSYVKEFKAVAGVEGMEVKTVSKSEYARLRREFLPEGGVVQENENLDFFEKQVTFYTGDGFVLAGRVNNGTLYGVEFLGSEDIAPQIIRTLNCSEGVFRTKGEEKPFAMYFCMDNEKTPRYFGLAFD